ncbi:excinuclease ABC subunit UvrC [Sinimarinibacterium sp. CAU 1509]|uniref:excinuclease ABC subunit UvrC n=1 Tax=Sinimarinibacterium sp. CAU 1509 TaxID=2562283 RepID=UPI0010AC0E9A|nr:excinuclease ABC subunit UvrC [Sinimarinibacterium sp. CAU 1509]TJY62329.1 excinuclease ABC subunit UvrC [Sinimarinibacterium sp. CAU 1509]
MTAESRSFDPRAFLSQLSTSPGVYRMYGAGDELLYVGKARNLRKRVSSYFLRASGNPRIESMVSQIQRVDVTLTHTEDEALLLEAALIKDQSPRYNVQYRDDKSYPYLRFTSHRYPRIAFYRGATNGADRYFGPFPSAAAVRETLQTLQKLFHLRPCRDSFFAHRDRPCLQYQIKRCSAPCVGLIAPEDYARDLANAARLLEGKGESLAQDLTTEMQRAADTLDFEQAAKLRDQIAALKRVRQSQSMTGGAEDIDVIAVAAHASSSCVTVISVRDGVNLGHRNHFPKHPAHTPPEELLERFVSQHYLTQKPPPEVLLSHPLDDGGVSEEAISQHAGRRVRLYCPQRGAKLRLLEMAVSTAAQALSSRLVEAASMDQRLLELQRVFELEHPPRRIECFDISHTQGERAVASCVVFNEDGPLKSAYRKFNIEGIVGGDDYAAIAQAVSRRFARAKAGEGSIPDLLLIDGGQGQLNAALEALDELEMAQEMRVVGVAKGPTRKPGLEELWMPDLELPLRLPADSPALHLIQRVRDEAHRFAITGHRGRRDKARIGSDLDSIEGLGPARRKALLQTFGGLGQLKRAGIDELAQVAGISRTLAERIYAHFH